MPDMIMRGKYDAKVVTDFGFVPKRDDLILRAAAIEYLMTNMGWHDEDGYPVDDSDEKRAIITDLVNGIPAVDAVPVVKCWNCEHFVDMSGTSYPSYCYKHTTFDADGEFDNVFSVEPDKYCAWGKRRDSDGTD